MASIPPELQKLSNNHKNTKLVLDKLIEDNDADFGTRMLNYFNGKRVKILNPKSSCYELGTVYNAGYYTGTNPYEFYIHVQFDNGHVRCSSLDYVEFIDGL